MSCSMLRWMSSCLIIAVAILCQYACVAEASSPNNVKYALLVGCTKYPNNLELRQLDGPGNDIPLWAKLLTDPKGFAFQAENVTQLVGWPDDLRKRPTYKNVCNA